jgi:hypothetical protein
MVFQKILDGNDPDRIDVLMRALADRLTQLHGICKTLGAADG